MTRSTGCQAPRAATVDGTTATTTLAFELETAEGLRAQQGLHARAGRRSSSQFSAQVQQGNQAVNPIVEWGPGLGDDIARAQPGSFLSPNYLYHAQAIYPPGRRCRRARPPPSLGTGAVREGQFRWVGVDDHYFISAVLQPPAPLRVEYQPVTIPTMTTPPVTGHYVGVRVKFPAATGERALLRRPEAARRDAQHRP